jgi:hypothetical protein
MTTPNLKSVRPRNDAPRGFNAYSARALVDRADEAYRTIAVMLRQRADRAIAAESQRSREEVLFVVPDMIFGLPLYFQYKKKVINMLIEGLQADHFTVGRENNILHISWHNIKSTAKKNKKKKKKKTSAEDARVDAIMKQLGGIKM